MQMGTMTAMRPRIATTSHTAMSAAARRATPWTSKAAGPVGCGWQEEWAGQPGVGDPVGAVRDEVQSSARQEGCAARGLRCGIDPGRRRVVCSAGDGTGW